VESFDREAIVLVTSMGVLEVKGAELHILALDLEGGHCQVEGRIDLLAYRQQAPSRSRGPALRRLLR
jgi:sporulation protein YabP